jgi:hypothetical protein
MTDDAYSTAISLRFAWDRLMARRYVSGPHPRLLKFKNPAGRMAIKKPILGG